MINSNRCYGFKVVIFIADFLFNEKFGETGEESIKEKGKAFQQNEEEKYFLENMLTYQEIFHTNY